MNIPDDNAIRAALRDAEARGSLCLVAAVTGISGGVEELRRIMQSDKPMSVMDRGIIGLHLMGAK